MAVSPAFAWFLTYDAMLKNSWQVIDNDTASHFSIVLTSM